MKHIRIKNLRCFSDTDYIEIKPINILIGLNSSGKSSFARTFPLLRQSIERKISGPILWYGPYVDFGSYEEAKNRNNSDNHICLGFSTSINIDRSEREEVIKHESYINSDSDGNGQLESFKIYTDDFSISLDFKGGLLSKTSYNSSQYIEDKKGIISSDGTLIPRPLYRWGGLEILKYSPRHYRRYIVRNNNKMSERIADCENRIYDIIKPLFSHKTSKENIYEGITRLGVLTSENVISSLRAVFSSQSVFIKNIVQLTNEDIKEICARTWLIYLEIIVESIYEKFTKSLHNVRYVAPLRTTAERYYRHQDLKYDEVDHKGENLPLVLQSLSSQEKASFEEWTEDNFGFKIRVEKAGWQYAVKIKPNSEDIFTNISDMGFGYSQIAPIITSLWYEVHRNIKRISSLIFVIEQPELHLHPGYQAKFIDLVSKIYALSKQNNLDIRFIIETHSETLVNSLGKNIATNIVNENDASVLIFNKSIERAHFDKYGMLMNWPVGFFEAY
ncbi:TPA: AAA family ATPase [Aeromonas veronii]|nr:AAA family ATPase [Aeromonas veronii]